MLVCVFGVMTIRVSSLPIVEDTNHDPTFGALAGLAILGTSHWGQFHSKCGISSRIPRDRWGYPGGGNGS